MNDRIRAFLEDVDFFAYSVKDTVEDWCHGCEENICSACPLKALIRLAERIQSEISDLEGEE